MDYIDERYFKAVNKFEENGFEVTQGSNSNTEYGHSRYFYVNKNNESQDNSGLGFQVRVSDHSVLSNRRLSETQILNDGDIDSAYHKINYWFNPKEYANKNVVVKKQSKIEVPDEKLMDTDVILNERLAKTGRKIYNVERTYEFDAFIPTHIESGFALPLKMKNPDIRFDDGGEVKSNSFMKWYIDWYKGISDKMFIAISLPTIVTPFKEKNVVILDVFEKKDQSIDAKPYLKKIVEKADEYGVVIYLEPTPRHKYFQDNTEKKNKITKEYLVDYYQRFGFELTPNKQFMKRVPHFSEGGSLPNSLHIVIENVNPEKKFLGHYKKIFDIIEEDIALYNPYGTEDEKMIGNDFHIWINPIPDNDKIEKIKKLKGVRVLSNYYAEGGSVKRHNKEIMKKIKRGGITYGASHDNGGIPVKNASTGDMLEVEGGEGIVNKRSMASGKKVKLNGQEMTICEAVSQLNQMEGGVSFSCDDVEDMQFIEEMALGGELERGVRTEKEHIQVLKDLYSKRITPNEATRKIAEDHLKEDERYYSKLAKMEGKMAKGGETDEDNLSYAEAQERWNKKAGIPSQKEALTFVKENPEILAMLKNGGEIMDCGCGSYGNGGYVDTFVDERIVSKVEDKDNPFAKFGLKKNFRGDTFVRLDAIEEKSINFCDSFPQVCGKNMGILREDMPQIYEEYIPEYLDFLKDMGVDAKLEYDIPVKELTATQEDISVPRMSRMLKRLLSGYYIDSDGNRINPLKRKLIITKDNYVLDGHHRWATMYFLSPNNTIDALRVNADIKDIVPISKNFGMVQFQKFMYGGKVSVEGFTNINGLGVAPNASSVKTLKITRNIFPKAGLKISPLITYNDDNPPKMVFSENGFQIEDIGKRNLKFNTLRDIKSSLSSNVNDAIADYNLSIPDKDKQIFLENVSYSTTLEDGLFAVRRVLTNVNQIDTPAISILFYQYKSASITCSFIFNDKFIELYGDDLDVLEAILNGFSQIFKYSDNMDALVIDGNSTRSRKPRTAKTTAQPTQQPTQQGGYWRFKTEQEFKDDYGNDWRREVRWSQTNEMDYLLGQKIDNDKLVDGKPQRDRDLVNTKYAYGITSGKDDNWYVSNESVFKFVPETTQAPTQQGGYWRFKTKQELEDELGYAWRNQIKNGFVFDMDYLLGQKIDNDKLENGKPIISNNTFNTKAKYGITSGNKDWWSISEPRLFKFVPQSANSQLVPTKELDKKIQEVQDLMNSELFSPDEVVVQQVLIDELKNLNEQKQKSILSNYYSNDLNDLLQLYAQNISKGQRLTMDVACGKETPSGVPSELDETQYTLVRTPQFKAWFGDWEEAYFNKNYSGVSKAINERTGEPLVVYHGKGNMKVEATYFKLTGFPIKYFAENKSYSEWFKNNYNAVNVLYEFFINVSNPIDLSMVGLDEITPQTFVDLIEALYDYKIQTPLMMPDRAVKVWQILRGNPKMLTEIKEKTNYDGFIIYENNPQDIVNGEENITKDFIAYENNQYKSADGRNTTFFMDVDDFRFEKGGVTQHTL